MSFLNVALVRLLNFSQFMKEMENCNFCILAYVCSLWYDYFIFVYFRKVTIPLLNKKNSNFEILLEDMAMKGLNRQIKLMALVMVYLESCARGNVSIYYAEYCRRRSCSGLHCDSNTKCGTETYAAH